MFLSVREDRVYSRLLRRGSKLPFSQLNRNSAGQDLLFVVVALDFLQRRHQTRNRNCAIYSEGRRDRVRPITMERDKKIEPEESLFDRYRDEIKKAYDRAVREALLMHKRAGNPVPIERDGQIVWLQPNEIEV